jgi:hypothetical protein
MQASMSPGFLRKLMGVPPDTIEHRKAFRDRMHTSASIFGLIALKRCADRT